MGDQMAHFGIDEDGNVLNQTQFDIALQEFDGAHVGILPPWWVIHHVTPEGPPRDMGTWTEETFSEDQMAHFGIDEDGNVLDQAKFDIAMQELDVKNSSDSDYGTLKK